MSRRFKRQVLRALESALIAYLPIIMMALIRRGLARRGSRRGPTFRSLPDERMEQHCWKHIRSPDAQTRSACTWRRLPAPSR